MFLCAQVQLFHALRSGHAPRLLLLLRLVMLHGLPASARVRFKARQPIHSISVGLPLELSFELLLRCLELCLCVMKRTDHMHVVVTRRFLCRRTTFKRSSLARPARSLALT